MQTVAYQGVPGSFSYAACRDYFGLHETYIGMHTFPDVFAAVENGQVTKGMLPFENSIAGSIVENFDLLFARSVSIVGETYVHVEHMLMGIDIPGISNQERIAALQQVLSHPKALEQCTKFFVEHPTVMKVAYEDTAGAAQFVAGKNDASLAAIASREASELYGLTILQEHLEDNPKNWTRFLVIQKEPSSFLMSEQQGIWKSSIVCMLDNKPGTLYELLGLFAQRGVNVTKIESRPIVGKPFEYYFYFDFEFNASQYDMVRTVLKALEEKTTTLRIAGYYPKSKTAPAAE